MMRRGEEGATDVAAVLRCMLECRLGPLPRVPTADAGLTRFQQEAVERARAIIARRGGALLCDSVGLGKTHVACALIRAARAEGRPVLVSAPAQLARHWRRHLRGVRGWTWLSHTALSRGRTWSPRGGRGFVVIDEAHGFRNPATRRHKALAAITRHADALLVTATPVNNSLRDFLALVRLFAGDTCFADIGVADLAAAIELAGQGGDASAVRRVAEDVVIRRTRAGLRARLGDGQAVRDDSAAAPRLAFPRRSGVRMIDYDLAAVYPALLDGLGAALLELSFPAHRLGGNAVAGELMRLGLLKRLESGCAAFRTSLQRHARLLHHFAGTAAEGRLLSPREHRALFRDVGGAVQLAMPEIALRPWPRQLDRTAAIEQAEHDLRIVNRLLHATRATRADPKIGRLRELLEEDSVRSHPVLVFTEFRDTAAALWSALAPAGGVALVHGEDARLGLQRASRGTIIDRFAPRSNGRAPPPPHERVRILIATDVLAEGLNLQDARTVVSYDMPWNPVRLAQRIGRIDRLGSPHDEIAACAFRPEQYVDALLGLLRRVRQKVRAIRVVGGDAPAVGRGPGGGDRRRSGSRTKRCAGDAPPPRAGAGELARPDDRQLLRRDDVAWDILEGLRRAQLELGSSGAEERWPAGSCHPLGRARPAAAVRWTGRGEAVLCCVAAGAARWLVLVVDGRPPAVGGTALDEYLLRVVAAPAVAAPIPERASLDHAALRAARAVRARQALESSGRGMAASGFAAGRQCQKAARAVHRWLADRPGGATAADAALADELLQAIADGGVAAGGRRLGNALADVGSGDYETVRVIQRWVARHSPGPQPRRPPRPRACALLALVPYP
jgi:hypothetical protein